MIAIIDYGAGNLSNVKNMLDYLGQDSLITSSLEDIKKADRIILPGVGAFGYVMRRLKELNLDIAIKESISEGKPFLGICLGFQVLFEESEENPGVKGLGLFKGKVVKFQKGKIPHIGWNEVNITETTNVFESAFKNGFAYFVHSYYPVPEDKSIIFSLTDYHSDFCSGIKKDNVLAVQFHPERSGKWGIDFYRKWLNTNMV